MQLEHQLIRVFRHHIQLATLIELFTDASLCFAAVVMAVIFQTYPSQPVEHYGRLSGAIVPGACFALMMVVLYGALGVYRRSESTTSASQFGRALIAIAAGCPLAYVMFGALQDGERAQAAIGYTVLYLFGGLVLMRNALGSARRAGLGARRLLVIGAGAQARQVAQAVADLPIQIVAYFPAGNDVPEVPASMLLKGNEDLADVVRRLKVDEVLVAVREQRGGGVPMQTLLDCRVQGVPVLDLAAFYERARGEVPIDYLKSSWLIYGEGFAQDSMRNNVKRSFDVLASLTLLILTWPIMLVTAIAIRIESPGPVVFRQERTGLGGRSFTCLKFRSMRRDAEKPGVAVWAKTNDDRVTRIGRFIRKTRIDELPQLLNILRGEMSLVGPRPERPTFVAQLKEQVPYYDIRHTVKPGLTGWAQVRFNYGASIEDSRRKLQFDLYYVKNHSLFLDLVVLFETVRVILFREGAR